jgi:hypothetical protein
MRVAILRATLGLAALSLIPAARAEPPPGIPSLQEMAAAREDVWAEAAIRQPGGPSYEFFKDLLPPLRYVNTAFRHYPLALSAPAGAVKARWVSNGSGVNLRADKPPMWREVGTPVRFLVGDPPEPFGDDPARITGPQYADGYLPVVRVGYAADGTTYEQEAFAPVRGPFTEHGVVFVRFTARDKAGVVTTKIDASVKGEAGVLRDDKGHAVVQFDAAWKWDAAKQELRAALAPGASAVLAVLTKPLAQPPAGPIDYDGERRACIARWTALVNDGATFRVPEPIVQDAWRALVVGNYLLAVGDRMNYSAGNAYDHLYEGECGDATRALMLFGHVADARRMVGPLLDFNRQATRFHVAGLKLQMLAHYYWVTRDAAYLREKRSVWEPVVQFIVTSRKTDNGLLPRDNYAGDVNTQVYSLNSNAGCWRGLRDMAAVLDDLGERDRAAELRKEAAAFRQVILDAVSKSERRDATPPFVPVALFSGEPAHDPLTGERQANYYCLIIPYVLGSEVFGPGSERETWIIDYLRRHGGLAMGMIRAKPAQGQFQGEPGVNVLYTLRYLVTVLRRDDRDHALAGFYGQLAQAMTRGTFVGGEGSQFFRGDRYGRSFYLPPNSTANATFLTTLRYLLIQDWDGDGRPDTLRLLYGIPGRWLADGAVTEVKDAPSAFLPVSFRVESRLGKGEVEVAVQAPPRRPGRWLLRIPNPPGQEVVSARIGDAEVPRAADGGVDLSKREGSFHVTFRVRPAGR